MADSGEWKRFHDINHESQGALAEMNMALGSLRQWRNQRSLESTEQSSASPQTANAKTSRDDDMRACDTDNLRPPAEEDPLQALWQVQHICT